MRADAISLTPQCAPIYIHWILHCGDSVLEKGFKRLQSQQFYFGKLLSFNVALSFLTLKQYGKCAAYFLFWK